MIKEICDTVDVNGRYEGGEVPVGDNNIPRLIELTPEQSHAYWARLSSAGMVMEYKGRPLQYGWPFELSPAVTSTLRHGAEISWSTLTTMIAEAGGITPWLANGRAPQLGDAVLNFEGVNRQLEDRLRNGELPPMVFDVLWGRDLFGQARPYVTEIQIGIGYLGMFENMIAAGGFDPSQPNTWEGSIRPREALRRLRTELVSDEPIVVMDTNPYGNADSKIDQGDMARLLGESFPISPLDLHCDERGYFYYESVVDVDTRYPLMDHGTKRPIRPKVDSGKRYIKHILMRMTQDDLTTLDSELGDNHEQRQLILQFLQDPGLTHVWHTSWQYLGTKNDLDAIRRRLETVQHPLGSMFVAAYTRGEQVPQGAYARKPIDAVGGRDVTRVVVGVGEAVMVEPRYVYQTWIDAHPILVRVDPELQGKFPPIPASAPQYMRDAADPSVVVGITDVRFMSNLGCRQQDGPSGLFQLRPAPAFDFYGRVTRTNQGPIQETLAHIDRALMHRTPFGWSFGVKR